MLFKKISIIGIGLMGSSVARVIKKNNLCEELLCFDTSLEYMEKAKELGVVDGYNTLKAVTMDADLVILATPVSTYKNIVKEISPFLKEGSVITDVGSVKQAVIKDIMSVIPEGVEFVPGHPIAGSEKSGPEAGFIEMFQNRWFIFTPINKDETNLNKISKIWEAADMKISKMDAAHHDKVMAAVSHLPHLISYALVGAVDDLEGFEEKEIFKYSAGGFRDMTRLAGSDPTMWRDISLNNQEMILELLQRFTETLTALQKNIRYGEGDELFNLFEKTKEIRKGVIEAKQHRL